MEADENTLMLVRGSIRTINYQMESNTQEELRGHSLILPWLVEPAGIILSWYQTSADGRTQIEKLHRKKPSQEFVPSGEKVLARQISTESMKRMNGRCKFGIWLGIRNNSAEMQTVCSLLVTSEGWHRRADLTKKPNSVIGVPRRLIVGRWTVDRQATRVPPLPLAGARIQRGNESRSKILVSSEPLWDAQGATRSQTTKRPD